MTSSAATLAEFRNAVKATRDNLIAADRVNVGGKEVTVLARIQKRTSFILIPLGFGGTAVLYIAGFSRLGGDAFVALGASLAALAVTAQVWCVWSEMRYRARMTWVAACDVASQREAPISQESAQVGRGDESCSKTAVKNLIKRELKSLCSRRHIPGYAVFSRFTLIVLLIALAVTLFCALRLHMWDTWPPVLLPFLVCIFFWFFAIAYMHLALTKWLEDIVACSVFALTLGVQRESS